MKKYHFDFLKLIILVYILVLFGDATAQIITRKTYEHGAFGNVTAYVNDYDTTSRNDDVKTQIRYYPDSSQNYLVGIPVSVSVYDQSGERLRYRESEVDSTTGQIKRLRIDNGNGFSEYDYVYDTYGNISEMTLPANQNSERVVYRYQYDPSVRSYVVRTENVSLGYYSTATYSYVWGKPLTVTDLNGQVMQYSYDSRGRYSEIKAPGDTTLYLYTLKFEYSFNESCSMNPINQLLAVTYLWDEQHLGNPLTTVVLSDALGRVIQTKQDVEIGGSECRRVSGKVNYDAFGRAVKSWYPTIEPLTSDPHAYNTSVDTSPPALAVYEVLNRPVHKTFPDGSVNTMQYGFAGNGFKSTVTDALNNTITTVTDARGLKVKVEAPEQAITLFDYNALGELMSSTDPDSYQTFYDYNAVGQCTYRYHPDAGEDHYAYDAAGHLISHVTQNLLNESRKINYSYHYNQLTGIDYPTHSENNVYYSYGQMGAPYNRAGRVVMQEDASGYQQFFYGKLGEVIKNVRTFVLPNEDKSYTFTMKFKYDNWNRIQWMVYPDGDSVNYRYDFGGELQSMGSRKNGQDFSYIDKIEYDKFGNRISIIYGNGSETTYRYDVLQRLSNLTSYTGEGYLMQDMIYAYDNVGNMTDITNTATTMVDGLGGVYANHYDYDNLYRLKKSTGDYLLEMEYKKNGRIGRKRQKAGLLDYERIYSYAHNTNRVNLVKDVVSGAQQTFEWDANGNMTLHDNRRLCWDEENRLLGVADYNCTSYYQYDASGERSYKFTGQLETMHINGWWNSVMSMNRSTLYASPYLVADNKGYTKHYYAGSQRIASKIGGGMLAGISSPLNNEALTDKMKMASEQFKRVMSCLNGNDVQVEYNNLAYLHKLESSSKLETDLYFYHADHLGSSAWVTESGGKAVQHLQYLPFGERFVDQRSSDFGTRYTFSAKEKDEETGYGYFGARYYNSDLSIWLSVDPMAEKYPHQTNYVYCSNNPIRIIDPDGRDEYDWILGKDGNIYWDDKATSQATTKDGDTYLGKNVIIATHNRDANLNEPINSATFDLYLETNKEGPSASINGNTVPADGSTSGTLDEGLYSARFQGRASYLAKRKTDLALIINEGGKVPTAMGSPKSSMTGIFFHSGNNYQTSLFDSRGNAYSEGCLTGPCMPGSATIWNTFGQQLKGFNGNLYLRGRPQPAASSLPAID
ncbi:MAG: RHS repeat-associated core domain-containing protein, partial [Bacteroidales bacterium]